MAKFSFIGGTPSNFQYVKLLLGFNEGNGSTTADESSYNQTISCYSSAVTSTADKKFGASSGKTVAGFSAFKCGPYGGELGQDSKQISTPNGSTPFTIETFFNPVSVAGSNALFGTFNSPTDGWMLRYESGLLEWYNVGQTSITGPGQAVTMSVGTWYHVAVDFDGSRLRIFVGGVLLSASNSSQRLITGSGVYFTVGYAGIYNSSAYFDEVRATIGYNWYGSDTSFTAPTAEFPRS